MKKILCFALLWVLVCTMLPVRAEEISAQAAVVLCGDTGEVLFEKNAEEKLPMASTTKIMTALLLCEAGDLETEVAVTKEMVQVEGSSMGLLPGDTATKRDLLYGMMLASGNDAANATAILLGGTVEKFVEKMNERAAQLGLCNTHFCTPSGLDADAHYTTAHDLARLAMFALQNEDFAAAASAKTATLYYGNPPYARTLRNHNRLLFQTDGVVGVKTGFTKKSGRCLVSAMKKDGRYAVAVTLNDPDDWADHQWLLNLALERLSVIRLGGNSFEIPAAERGQNPLKVAEETAEICAADANSITSCVRLPSVVAAPVKKGTRIGTAEYRCNGKTVAVTAITAAQDLPAVDVPQWRRFFTVFRQLLLSLS